MRVLLSFLIGFTLTFLLFSFVELNFTWILATDEWGRGDRGIFLFVSLIFTIYSYLFLPDVEIF